MRTEDPIGRKPSNSRDARPFKPIWKSFAEFDGVDPKPQSWTIDGLVARGAVTILRKADDDKDMPFMVGMLCSVASGKPFAGRSVAQGLVRGRFDTYGTRDVTNWARSGVERICPDQTGLRQLMIIEGRDGSDRALWRDGMRTARFDEQEHALRGAGQPTLLLLDDAEDFFDGDVRDKRDVRSFLHALTGIALSLNVGIVLAADLPFGIDAEAGCGICEIEGRRFRAWPQNLCRCAL